MKLLLTAAALSLFVSVPSSALPRQDNQPPQDNEKDKRDQPPPAERQDDRKQQEDRKRQDDKRQQEDRKQQDDKRQQDEKNRDRDRSQQDRNQQDRDRSQQQGRDRTQQQDRDRTQQQDRDRATETDRDRSSREGRDQRSGEPPRQDPNRIRQDRDQQSASNSGVHGRGQRIPDDRFRSSFGREHTFRVQRQSGGGQDRGDQRFPYGGYYFEYVDAWPNDWSYNDDFYIESMGDDYYLYDMRHPEMRILVIVVE
jgi:hypothetical protein